MMKTTEKAKKDKRHLLLTKRARANIFIALMLAFPIAQFLLCYVYVNISSFAMAFQSPTDGSFSWENFERFFHELSIDSQLDYRIRNAFINSLLQGFVTSFINVILTVVATYLLYKGFFMHKVFRVIFYLPGIICSVASYILTTFMFSAGGPYMSLLEFLGAEFSEDMQLNGFLATQGVAFPTILFISLAISGGNIVLLTGVLRRVPAELFEAAKLDGCGMAREFWNIAVPLIWPTVSTIWVFALAGCFTSYLDIMMLTNGEYGTLNFGLWMMRLTLNAAEDGNGSLNYPAAIGLLVTFVVAPITIGLRALTNKVNEAVEY